MAAATVMDAGAAAVVATEADARAPGPVARGATRAHRAAIVPVAIGDRVDPVDPVVVAVVSGAIVEAEASVATIPPAAPAGW